MRPLRMADSPQIICVGHGKGQVLRVLSKSVLSREAFTRRELPKFSDVVQDLTTVLLRRVLRAAPTPTDATSQQQQASHQPKFCFEIARPSRKPSYKSSQKPTRPEDTVTTQSSQTVPNSAGRHAPKSPPTTSAMITAAASAVATVAATSAPLLASRGLDLCGVASLAAYNAAAPATCALPLPPDTSDASLLVIGASRALWEPFVASLVRDVELGAAPLNTYVEDAVRAVLGKEVDARFDWEIDDGARFCARTAAVLAGFGKVDAGSQLVVHPVFGPWLSVRSVVLYGGGADSVAKVPRSEPVSRTALAELSGVAAEVQDVANWRDLVKSRDAIGVSSGQQHPFRYSDEQIEYHYTWNKDVLSRARLRAISCRDAVVCSLTECLERIPAGEKTAILLSGGIDSSVLMQTTGSGRDRISAEVVSVAITVKVGDGGSDMEHARAVARSCAGVQHVELEVSLEEVVGEMGWVAKVLESFDPMELRNAVIIGIALKYAAEELKCKRVITGDGADELFAGYSFMLNMPETSFLSFKRTMIENMSFSGKQLADSLNISIVQPYLEPAVRTFAASCPRTDLIGHGVESDETGIRPTFIGKAVLRRAFPDCSTSQRKKVPIESGSGATRLRLGYFDKLMNDGELARAVDNAAKEHNVKIRDREHAVYFAKLLDAIGGSLTSLSRRERFRQFACNSCGFSLGSESQLFCVTCGQYPAQ